MSKYCVALMLVLAMGNGAVAAQLSFNAQNTIITFDNPVKLADVLEKLPNPHAAYWAGAGIYELDSAQAEAQRAHVMNLLAELIREQTAGSERHILLSNMYRDISNWHLMRRLNIDVDYDQSRLNPKRNPGFVSGRYYIKAKPQVASIDLMGQLQESVTLAFENALTVSDYLESVESSDYADNDYVYVIEPNGKLTKQGIAYWNDTHYKPMPGSVIFVPLQTGLFSNDIDQLNDQIAKLLQHRM